MLHVVGRALEQLALEIMFVKETVQITGRGHKILQEILLEREAIKQRWPLVVWYQRGTN